MRRPAASNQSGAVELDATPRCRARRRRAPGAALISSAAPSASARCTRRWSLRMLDRAAPSRAAWPLSSAVGAGAGCSARTPTVAAPVGAGQAPSAARGTQVDARRAEARGDVRWSAGSRRSRAACRPAPARRGRARRCASARVMRLDLVVRHVEHGRAEVLLDALQLEAQVVAQLGVERGQRLVHQRHRRLAHQRAADRHALHLRRPTARWPGCASLSSMCSSCATSLTLRAHLGLGRAAQRRAQREGEVVEDAQVRVQRVLLEHEGHVAQRRRECA